MPSRSAETTSAATGWGRIGSDRLAVARLAAWPGIRIVIVAVGIGPVIAIIAVTIGGILTISGAGRVVAGRRPGTIGSVIAADAAGCQSIAVGTAIEGPQMRIDPRRGIFGTYGQYPAAIIRVVEIGIIPAVPHKIAVPAHIRIPESQPERRTEPESQPISVGRIAVAICTADTGRIIGIIRAVIVKIRPAGGILHFKPDILIIGRRAVIVALLRTAGTIIFRLITGCGSLVGGRRIIDVIWCLCSFPAG